MQIGLFSCTKCPGEFTAIIDSRVQKLCPECRNAKKAAAKARKSMRTFVLDLEGLQVQILVGGSPIFTMQCDSEEAVHEFVKDQQERITTPSKTVILGKEA